MLSGFQSLNRVGIIGQIWHFFHFDIKYTDYDIYQQNNHNFFQITYS